MPWTALLYTLVPVLAAVAGGVWTAFRPPSARLRSAVQHLAAEVVFAAAAGELLPDVVHANAPLHTLAGATVGVAVMVGLGLVEDRAGGAAGLIATAALDVLIDGLVLGLAFVHGARQGLLLTVALTVELVFLSLSVAGAVGGGKGRVVGSTTGVALALPVGCAVGLLLGGLPKGALGGFFAFGLVALLYLVTEELLAEAHEVRDTPLTPVAFFVGFLAVIYLEELL